MASQGKIAEVIFENAIETYENQSMMLDKVDRFEPDSGTMQNASNVIWRTVQQSAPVIEGWDLSGQETDIIEETYPSVLGTPKNDFFQQRADNMRDMGFWERRGKQSGLQQVTELNRAISDTITTQGSIFYRSNATSGYDYINEANTILSERQTANSGDRYFGLSDRSMFKFSSDLAGRQTLQGRPESDAWAKGQVGANVAGMDVFQASFLSNVAGGALTTTTTALVSEKPEGGSVDSVNGVVTNIDYRRSDVPVADSSAFAIGDKVSFDNAGTFVESLALADRKTTGQAMTFTIIGKPDGTTVTVSPKPIAVDDPSLSVLEKAYANIDTQITSGANMTRLNTDASARGDIFWDKSSIEVLSGNAPIQLLNEFGGMEVRSHTMSNGQTMYIAYDGDIDKLTFKCRLFTWYNVTNKNPSANGVSISY